ncbi:hypothetical protein MAHJHV60_47130 [Mycobacterium avium subsp. hominissuis]
MGCPAVASQTAHHTILFGDAWDHTFAEQDGVVRGLRCHRGTTHMRHHTILFGDAWDHTFADIIGAGQLMRDPSLLVTRPTASDPTLSQSMPPDSRFGAGAST